MKLAEERPHLLIEEHVIYSRFNVFIHSSLVNACLDHYCFRLNRLVLCNRSVHVAGAVRLPVGERDLVLQTPTHN